MLNSLSFYFGYNGSIRIKNLLLSFIFILALFYSASILAEQKTSLLGDWRMTYKGNLLDLLDINAKFTKERLVVTGKSGKKLRGWTHSSCDQKFTTCNTTSIYKSKPFKSLPERNLKAKGFFKLFDNNTMILEAIQVSYKNGVKESTKKNKGIYIRAGTSPKRSAEQETLLMSWYHNDNAQATKRKSPENALAVWLLMKGIALAKEVAASSCSSNYSRGSSSQKYSFCGVNDTCYQFIKRKKGAVTVQCTKGLYTGQEKCLSYKQSTNRYASGCGMTDIGAHHYNLETAGNIACGR